MFDQIKAHLSSPPILAYPDFNLPFELHTDASTKALGAVLYQVQDGKKRVVSYASRALNKAAKNYSAFKLVLSSEVGSDREVQRLSDSQPLHGPY